MTGRSHSAASDLGHALPPHEVVSRSPHLLAGAVVHMREVTRTGGRLPRTTVDESRAGPKKGAWVEDAMTAATTTVTALRAWAAGSYPAMAAVELLARAFGGRFATRGHPWIVDDDDDGRAWLETRALRSAPALSGGERRVLRLAAALLDAEPIDIVDVVTGLDRTHLDLVLAALAHAGGSHEHAALTLDRDGTVHLSQPGPLHRWPPDGPP